MQQRPLEIDSAFLHNVDETERKPVKIKLLKENLFELMERV